MTHQLLLISLILLAACSIASLLSARFKVPSLLGYLLVGALLGPSMLNLVAAGEALNFLSELGVVVLLFMVGLEFSLKNFWATRRKVLVAGMLQLILVSLPVIGALYYGQWTLKAACLVGIAVAMSSTALVAKQLADQGELTTRHGQTAVAVLVFQDLMTIPLLTVLAIWGRGEGAEIVAVVLEVLMVLMAAAVAAVIAHFLFHRCMIWVARHGSEEAFLLTSLTIILVSAAGFHALGVSPALGAFLAGMVLGESDFRHHMEEKIHPFRDVLVGIFFVTIGLQLDVGLIMSEPFKIALWLVVLVPAKMMLNTLALRLSGLSTTDAVRTGLILGHGGEFALLMLVMAMQMSVLEVSQGQPLLVALVLSMAVAPIIIKHHARIGKLFSAPSVKERPQKEELDAAEQSEQLKQHAIICGAGKVGLVVCQMLSEARRPYILIESSYEAYLAALQQGYPVIYGDASRSATLKAAGIKRAALLVVTFSATKPIERLLNWLGKDCPDLPLVVSTDNDRLFQVYRDKHPVYTLIEPLAAGTALAEKVLALMGVSESEARLRADAIRSLDAPESI